MIDITRLLPRVSKAARYTGGELNSVRKEWSAASARVALIYPDVYEVGMSNLGLQILYDLVNRDPELLAERAYSPWVDMEAQMREQAVPLFSLESRRPLAEFDILGISVAMELAYTNCLNLIDLAGLPVKAAERDQRFPIVLGGGTGAYNPEPMAPFFDLFAVGDGEELLLDLMRLYSRMRTDGVDVDSEGRVLKTAFLRRAAGIQGVYVPTLYRPEEGTGRPVPASEGVPVTVTARRVSQLVPSPLKPVVPFVEAVHDRAMIEVQRGCTRGCRFCQAGIVYRPVRERPAEEVLRDSEQLLANTGYSELSLVSLSTSDYSGIDRVVNTLGVDYPARRIKVSLPSLRVDSFSVKLAKDLRGAYGGGVTFAPEAGTQRMRDVINKGITQDDIDSAVESAFVHGWNSVKLYFMIGLPTESSEDVEGIVKMAYHIRDIGRRHAGPRTKVKISVGAFIPKGQSPFQWCGQESYDSIREKLVHLQKVIRGPGLSFSWHEPETSVLEAALARGDRRTAEAVYQAWKLGCRFDAWSEHFSFEKWKEGFRAAGLEMHAEAEKSFGPEDRLPWEHISAGVEKRFLLDEYQRGLSAELSEDCRWGKCLACGVRQSFGGC